VPETWTLRNFPGLQYKIIHGDSDKDFAPSVLTLQKNVDMEERK
jgi:hypothetical protein